MASGTFAAAALHGLAGPGIHGVGVALSVLALAATWRLHRAWQGGLV
jgi:hypothetical protein